MPWGRCSFHPPGVTLRSPRARIKRPYGALHRAVQTARRDVADTPYGRDGSDEPWSGALGMRMGPGDEDRPIQSGGAKGTPGYDYEGDAFQA